MSFTKEQRKKIGDNIKAIRLGLDCKSHYEFWCKLGMPKGLKESTLLKIEEGNYKSLDDEKINQIALLTGLFPYTVIVNYDLTKLIPPGSLVMPIKDFEEVSQGHLFIALERCFPFITSKEAENNTKFVDAYINCLRFQRILLNPSLDLEADLPGAADYFFICFSESLQSTPIVEAAVNFLSTLGYIFFFDRLFGVADYNESNEELITVASKLASKFDFEKLKENTKKFLSIYEEGINLAISALNKFGKYPDYVAFYNAIRFYLAMFNEEEIHMSTLEMQKFGFAQLQILKNNGNKFAIKCFE